MLPIVSGELGGKISGEARKLFIKIKDRPEIAKVISAKALPPSTTLHKVYATTEAGPRRLLFLCRHTSAKEAKVRWVLLKEYKEQATGSFVIESRVKPRGD